MKELYETLHRYPHLNEKQTELMNKVISASAETYRLIDDLEQVMRKGPIAPDGSTQPNMRWLKIGRSNIQMGFMALERSVANTEVDEA